LHNAIAYVVKKATNEINLYKNIYNIKMQQPNGLKKLYFTTLVLEDIVYEQYKTTLYKSFFLIVFSYFKSKEIELSDNFKKRTFSKIEITISYNQHKTYFGKYGLYFILSALLRNNDK